MYSPLVRLRDPVVALFAFVLVAPLLLLHAAYAGLVQRIVPWQSRKFCGPSGKPFRAFSLRSKVRVPAATHKGSRRHLVRQAPRLLNVVAGQMALVGPEPLPGEAGSEASPTDRSAVRPGIIGLRQLSGARDKPGEKHPEYDRFYERNRSFGLDIWLMWRTLVFLATGRSTGLRLAVKRWERDPAWRDGAPQRVRAIPRRKGPTPWRRALLMLVGVVVVAGLPGLVGSYQARGSLEEGRRALAQVQNAALRLEPGVAEAALDQAAQSFALAGRQLNSPATLGLRAIPGLNNNLQVARAVAEAGEILVLAGRRGMVVLESLPIQDGRVAAPFSEGVLDVASFAAAREPAQQMHQHVSRARDRVTQSPTGFLLPPVASARDDALLALDAAQHQAEVAAAAAFLIPRVFGGESPKTWVLGAENSSELRGRGGFIGSFGILHTEGGRASLGDFTSVSGNLPRISAGLQSLEMVDPEYARQYSWLGGVGAWANLMMNPDFAGGAQLFLSKLEPVMDARFDGLIALDPTGLSYLLEATGPVNVDGIPQPITSENIVELSLNELYIQFEDDNPDRRELLTDIAGAVWESVLTTPNLDPRAILDALIRAAGERRMVMYAVDAREQQAIETLGLGGRVEQTDGDYLLLVGQNFGENKADYYLTRAMDYEGTFDLDGNLDARLRVTVTNTAPADTRLPSYIAGERDGIDLGAGRARTFFSVFVPQRAQLRSLHVDGQPSGDLDNSEELGKRRMGRFVELGAGESQTFTIAYRLPNAIRDGTYSLSIQNQSTVVPDQLSINLELPPTSEISGRSGFARGDALVWTGDANRDIVLAADISTSWLGSLAQRVVDQLSRPVFQAGPDS